MIWNPRVAPQLRIQAGTIGASVSQPVRPGTVTRLATSAGHRRFAKLPSARVSASLRSPSIGGRPRRQNTGEQQQGDRPEKPQLPRKFVVEIDAQQRRQEGGMARGRKNETTVLKSGACHLQVCVACLLSTTAARSKHDLQARADTWRGH